MSQQQGLDHDGTEPTGSSKSDHDDDSVQKKSENVAHAQDGIKLSKLKNSGPLVEFATDRRETPMALEKNPLTLAERQATIADIKHHNPGVSLDFWDNRDLEH